MLSRKFCHEIAKGDIVRICNPIWQIVPKLIKIQSKYFDVNKLKVDKDQYDEYNRNINLKKL